MSATRTPEQKAAHAARMRAARAAKKAATGEQPAPTGGTTVTVDVPTDPTGVSILAEPIIADRKTGMTLAELKTKYGLPGDRIREILNDADVPATAPKKSTTPARPATPKPSAAKATAPASGAHKPGRIAAHILSAFADVPVGATLSVTDMAKHRSEEYGDQSPSAACITDWIYPPGGAAETRIAGLAQARTARGGKAATKVDATLTVR